MRSEESKQSSVKMKCATTLPFLFFVLSVQLLTDLSEAHSYSLINPFQRIPYRHPRSCCRHANCGCGKLATHKQFYVPAPQPAPCRVVKSPKPQQFTEIVYIDDKSPSYNQNPAACSTCQVPVAQPCPCATKLYGQTGNNCAGKCNPTACEVCQPDTTICSSQGQSACACECHQGNRMVRRSVDYVKDQEQDSKRLYVVYDPESAKTEEMSSEKFVQKRSEETPVQFIEERTAMPAEQPRPVYQHQQLQNFQPPLKVRRILQVVQPGDSEYQEVVEAYEEPSDVDNSQITENKPAAYKLVLRNANGDDILVDADSAIVEDEPEQKDGMTMATPSMVRVQKVEVPATSTTAMTSEETTTRTA